MAESFFATLKLECMHRQSWATLTQDRRAIFEQDSYHCVQGLVDPAPRFENGREERAEAAEFVFEVLVADDEPTAACVVATRGRLFCDVDAFENGCVVDGPVEVESLGYGTGRGGEPVGGVEIEACF